MGHWYCPHTESLLKWVTVAGLSSCVLVSKPGMSHKNKVEIKMKHADPEVVNISWPCLWHLNSPAPSLPTLYVTFWTYNHGTCALLEDVGDPKISELTFATSLPIALNTLRKLKEDTATQRVRAQK